MINGLKGEDTQDEELKTEEKSGTINKNKQKFKDIENALLYAEDKVSKANKRNIIRNHTPFSLSVDAVSNTISAANLVNNTIYDIKNTIIEDQADTKKLRLGALSMRKNGCGVIAVNNALNILGYDTSIAKLVNQFERSGVVVADNTIHGIFGSNPYGIPMILSKYGVKTEEVSYNEMIENEGVYIVSYWNSDDYLSAMHIVAVEIEKGKLPYVYNANYGKMASGEFVVAYKLEN